MHPDSPRWKEITPSQFPWEREALEFVRAGLPDRDPYLAWANFELIADDGSINEVDLLVLTPRALFLVEIKSRPGVVEGDAGTWTWTHEGRRISMDNPLLLANLKAKRLASLLKRRKAFNKVRVPYVEARVFCSAPGLVCRLDSRLRSAVHLRDRPEGAHSDEHEGILAALTQGLPLSRQRIDRSVARAVAQGVDQAGIRPHQASSRVGDYQLGQRLFDGPGYQDWEASHVSLPKVRRRVRLYALAPAESASTRETLLRAARREFQVLEGVQHPGILRAVDYREHERGPALIFEHTPGSLRLDFFLSDQGERLGLDGRLHLLRQVAEAIHYAHQRKLYHRALAPQSILVVNPESKLPRIQLFNWQTARREEFHSSSRGSTGTSHLGQLVEDASLVYMAPEALTDPRADSEALDVFSLGALAHYLFSQAPPARSAIELGEKLREGNGLHLAAMVDGISETLETLVITSTSPLVTSRLDSVATFLAALDEVEDDLTRPEQPDGVDAVEAKAGDSIGRFKVKKRLGTGSTSVALLVEEGEGRREGVLKVALGPEHHDRLRAEAEVLKKLRHQHVCGLRSVEELGERLALLMDKAGDRTLGQRLRSEGPLHVDLLQRFGEDLLQTLDWLEHQGIPHRDIKPDNIGVSPVGRGDRLHLVLFDFSLARTSAENIRAGTVPYLDPFLSLRKPPRWDLHAERFAAAMTLYEMATGTLPRWGDGHSDPAVIPGEATLEAERFDPDLRDGLVAFFAKALRRDYRERFGNAEEMLEAWRQVFKLSARAPDTADEAEAWTTAVDEAIAGAKLETPLALLGLGTRALNALDRVKVATITDLLALPTSMIYHMRGVGHKTRKELADVIAKLSARFPDHPRTTAAGTTPGDEEDALPAGVQSLDLIAERLVPRSRRGGDTTEARAGRALLGLGETPLQRGSWSTQTEVARALDVTRARVGQVVAKLRARWERQPALTRLRDEMARAVDAQGGVVAASELVAALLTVRGSAEEEPRRSQIAAAVARALVEAEQSRGEPRYVMNRSAETVLIANRPELADYAERLGTAADRLATDIPLSSPARVLETLRAVRPPGDATAFPPNRLAPLAVAASKRAALSSRLEIYPRGMDAARALRQAQQALLGALELTVEQLQARVRSRYAEAEPLPGRPRLDDLLKEVGLDFAWHPDAARGRGAYRPPTSRFLTASATSTGPARPSSAPPVVDALGPEGAEARQFQGRLEHALKRGGFLALTVEPRHLRDAEQQLLADFGLLRRSLEHALIHAMRQQAQAAGADWGVVRRADAAGRDSESKFLTSPATCARLSKSGPHRSGSRDPSRSFRQNWRFTGPATSTTECTVAP